GPVQPGLRPGDGARLPRRDPAQGGAQDRALLLDVRAEVLLDEDQPGDPRRSVEAEPCGGRRRHGGDVAEVPRAGLGDLSDPAEGIGVRLGQGGIGLWLCAVFTRTERIVIWSFTVTKPS